jgi:hypothetical protein
MSFTVQEARAAFLVASALPRITLAAQTKLENKQRADETRAT